MIFLIGIKMNCTLHVHRFKGIFNEIHDCLIEAHGISSNHRKIFFNIAFAFTAVIVIKAADRRQNVV